MFTLKMLSPGDYQPYFQVYLDLVPEGDIRELLKQQVEAIGALYRRIDEPTSQIVHAPYTWTIRQVMGHLIDVERIFASRAHRIASRDPQSLPGFDQDIYVSNTDYTRVSLVDLTKELVHLRKANCIMFERFSNSMWGQSGNCDGNNVSVIALACILVGHINHHNQIVESRIT